MEGAVEGAVEEAWGRTDGEASEPTPPAVRCLWNETSGSAELSGSVSLDGRKDCRFGRALLIAKKLFLGAVRNARHRRCQIHHINALPTIYRNYTATGSHRLQPRGHYLPTIRRRKPGL